MRPDSSIDISPRSLPLLPVDAKTVEEPLSQTLTASRSPGPRRPYRDSGALRKSAGKATAGAAGAGGMVLPVTGISWMSPALPAFWTSEKDATGRGKVQAQSAADSANIESARFMIGSSGPERLPGFSFVRSETGITVRGARNILAEHVGDGEMGIEEAPGESARSEDFPLVGVKSELVNILDYLVIFGLFGTAQDMAGHAIDNAFRGPARRRGNHPDAHILGFDQDIRQSFEAGKQDEDVHLRHPEADRRRPAHEQKAVGDAIFLGELDCVR